MTIALPVGEHSYKFRNGYSSTWEYDNWEADGTGNALASGGCSYGTYNDRRVVVSSGDGAVTHGPFCWGSCFACAFRAFGAGGSGRARFPCWLCW